MQKIRILARFVAKPGCEEELRRLLSGMLEPTHAEAGCEIYELYESDEPGRFYFYELWESQETIDAHAASPHFQHLAGTVDELLAEPFEVNFLQPVSGARG